MTTRTAPQNARLATIDRLITTGGLNPAMTTALQQSRARLQADQPVAPEADAARIAAPEGRVAGLEVRVDQLEAAAAPASEQPDDPPPAAAAQPIDVKGV